MQVGCQRTGGVKALPGAFLSILTVFTSFQRTVNASTDSHLATTNESTQPPLDQLSANILPLENAPGIPSLEVSQQLSGFLRAQLIKNITNHSENTAILKEQLSNFSQFLQLFIESSYDARTCSQFEDSLQMFLLSVGDVLETSTIGKKGKSLPEGAAACLVQPPTGALLKWLRPFESLLSFVEDERINIETIILDKDLRETIAETNVVIVGAESNLTNLIALQKIQLLSLQAEKDGVANLAKDTVESIKLNCSTNLSNRGTDHQTEILKVASNITERENGLKERLAQEKAKRAVEAIAQDDDISIQNQALEYERNLLAGKLQELRRQEAERNMLLQRQHQAELVIIQEACNAREAEKKIACNESLSNLRMAQEKEELSWLTESQLRVAVCKRTIAELDFSCNQLLTNLRGEHAQELERLRLHKEALENCTRLQEETDYYDYSSAEVERVQFSTENTLSQLRRDISELKESCSREIERIDRRNTERKNSLMNDFHRDTLSTETYCISLIAGAERTALADFRKARDEYTQTWKSTGSCCYPRNGYCRDGASGTPCCSTGTCTYVFLWANCCRCGGLCRM